MIYKVKDHYVISSSHVWMPGAYDSERAAKYAFRFPDKVLRRLQDSVNPGGVITYEMLQQEGRPMAKANLEVIESVLRDAKEPLRVNDIVTRAGDRLPTKSLRPQGVVTRDLALDIRDNPQSKFRRVSPGLYELKTL